MVKPYLSLWDRISQLWFNKLTLFLCLLVFKIHIFRNSVLASLNIMKAHSKALCNSISEYSLGLGQMYAASSHVTNNLVTLGVNETNRGFLKSLELIITGVEQMVLFTIDMIIGTYVCVLTVTIDSTAGAALNATELVINLANRTIVSVAEEIQDGLDDLESLVNGAINLFDMVEDFFTGSYTQDISRVNFTVDELRNWRIDPVINTRLQNLTNNLPNFDDVMNYTHSLLNTPFNSIRDHINSSNYQIMQQDELRALNSHTMEAQFCSPRDIEAVYDDLQNSVNTTTRIIVSTFLILAVLVIGYFIWVEYKSWKLLQQLSDDSTKDVKEKMLAYKSRTAALVYKLIPHGSKNEDSIKWFVAYVTSSNSLVIIILGVTGLISVLLQYLLLHIITKDISPSVDLNSFTRSLNTNMSAELDQWTNAVNSIIVSKEDEVNENLFGWVDNSTHSVNETINGFISHMDASVQLVFRDTPLAEYVQGLIYCVIERKLEKIQDGLTWVQNNAEIKLPLIDSGSISPWSSSHQLDNTTAMNRHIIKSNLSSTIQNGPAAGFVNSDHYTTRELQQGEQTLRDASQQIIASYRNSLKTELCISLGLVGIWLLQCLVGSLILISRARTQKREEESVLNFSGVKYDISSPSQISVSQFLDKYKEFVKLSDESENHSTEAPTWSEKDSYELLGDLSTKRLSKRWVL